MSKVARILLVSAFGREHWLAAQLAQKGFEVYLVDVTTSLGLRVPEDIEGPFGFFKSANWPDSYKDRLVQDALVTESETGFNLWLKDGPVELRSSTTTHRLAKLFQGENIQKYVLNHETYSEIQKKETAQRLRNLEYSQRWLAHLAFALQSNSFYSPEEIQNDFFVRSHLAPLRAPYFIRQTENQTLDNSLQWCEKQGVHVIRNAKIHDMAVQSGRITGLEIHSEESGLWKAHQFVWGLTSLETEFLSRVIFSKLFDSVLEPYYFWQRFPIFMEASEERDALPPDILLLEDLDFPWTHDNFILLRKGASAGLFHAWILLPYSQRFQKQNLEFWSAKIISRLNEKLFLFKAKAAGVPAEADLSSKDLGGVLFPVYSAKTMGRIFYKKLKNLHFDSPEFWPLLSWQGAYLGQSELYEKINKWWTYMTPSHREKELSL